MKRIFTILSTIIVSLYLVYFIDFRADTYIRNAYPFAMVNYSSEGAGYEEAKDVLTNLANSHHSLILKCVNDIVDYNETEDEFEVFGNGTIPKGLKETKRTDLEEIPFSGYYIIAGGNLTLQEFSDTMDTLGYPVYMQSKPISQIKSILVNIGGNRSTLLAVIIIVLTYMSFTMILSSKQMRSSGIRMISGMSIQDIIKLDLLKDIKTLAISFVIGTIVGMSCMFIKDRMIYQLITFFFKGLGLYLLILFFVSIILSVTYAFSLKQVNLMSVIKGKLPTKRLLAIMLVGQMLALIVVGWSAGNLNHKLSYQKTLNKAAEQWKENRDYFVIETGTRGNSVDNSEMHLYASFNKDVLKNTDSLLAYSYIGWEAVIPENRKTQEEYTTQKNVLYVRANYFDIQNIKLDEQLKTKLNTLTQGQFGLILPEKLKEKETYYVDMFEDYLNTYTKDSFEENAQSLFDMQPIVGYVPNHQERFVYNQVSLTADQYLKDPIIVVVSSDSFSDALTSDMFWSNANGSVFMKDYDKTMELLKQHDLYQFVASTRYCDEVYKSMKQSIDTEIISTIIETILCMVTSILLFNAMNLLYFEQFRRDIFIKRLSGMPFLQQHGRYIASQGITMIIGTILCVFLNQNVVASVLVLLVFMIDALIVLYRQMRKENSLAVSVLKGK